ncbi:MAG: hypothetical protein LBD30_04395 [Verrucomicrobiales bacterium]|jgi:hypothetical protein|nr:hypothetical protein [Verrucomicrobiales bacterium]
MNIDAIFTALQRQQVDYLLVGGMNFLLRHQPVATYDVDILVRDTDENLRRLNMALRELGAAWGETESAWREVPATHDWLKRQSVYCLTTRFGALDVFRELKGLEGRYDECVAASVPSVTVSGAAYRGLNDSDMLRCQLALSKEERKLDRINFLRKAMAS